MLNVPQMKLQVPVLVHQGCQLLTATLNIPIAQYAKLHLQQLKEAIAQPEVRRSSAQHLVIDSLLRYYFKS